VHLLLSENISSYYTQLITKFTQKFMPQYMKNIHDYRVISACVDQEKRIKKLDLAVFASEAKRSSFWFASSLHSSQRRKKHLISVSL